MNRNFDENVNKAVKDVLGISAEEFIILGISNDGIEIKSLLSEERLASYILDTLVGLILKRANGYEENLEDTLFFTETSILSELKKRIIKNFKK